VGGSAWQASGIGRGAPRRDAKQGTVFFDLLFAVRVRFGTQMWTHFWVQILAAEKRPRCAFLYKNK
jgi:hypothetical protein